MKTGTLINDMASTRTGIEKEMGGVKVGKVERTRDGKMMNWHKWAQGGS